MLNQANSKLTQNEAGQQSIFECHTAPRRASWLQVLLEAGTESFHSR